MDKKGFVESMIRAIASQDDAIECWMHLKDAADSIGGLERRFYNLNGLNRVKSFVESELIRIKAEKDHCAETEDGKVNCVDRYSREYRVGLLQGKYQFGKSILKEIEIEED